MAEKDIQLKAYELLRIMSEKKIDLDVCDIRNVDRPFYLKDRLNVKPKVSASPSEVFYNILEGKSGKIGTSVKMFFNVTKGQTRAIQEEFKGSIGGLLYEAEMYRKILQVAWHYSPNFVSFLGFGCCKLSRIKTYTDRVSWEKLQNKMRKYYESFLEPKEAVKLKIDDSTETCLLLTEKAGNGAYFGQSDASVTELYIHGDKEAKTDPINVYDRLPDADKQVVLFQLLYSLEVMARFKIMHNDLHTGNILLAKFAKPIVFTFLVGKKMFRINTRYVPYFFDWDFGYNASLGANPKIDNWANGFGIYNNFTPKFDLYTLACSLNFQGPVLSDFDIPVTKAQEEKDFVRLTKDEYDSLLALPVYRKAIVDDQLVSIYRQSSDVISRLASLTAAGQAFPPNSILLYYLIKTGSSKYFFMYWKPFGCRMTSMSKDFPTPLQLLETKFSNLEIPLTKGFPKNVDELMKNYPGGEQSHIYKLPTSRNIQVKLRDKDVEIDPNTGATWEFV